MTNDTDERTTSLGMRIIGMVLMSVALLGSHYSPCAADGAKSAEEIELQARAYYRVGAFQEAARTFAKAYESDGKPTHLFNAGLAYEKAGEKRLAAEFYGRYLGNEQVGDKVVEARARKLALDNELRAAREQAAHARELQKDDFESVTIDESTKSSGPASAVAQDLNLSRRSMDFRFGARLAATARWNPEESSLGSGLGGALFGLLHLSTANAGEGQLLLVFGGAVSQIQISRGSADLQHRFYSAEAGLAYRFWRQSERHIIVGLTWNPGLYEVSAFEMDNSDAPVASSTEFTVLHTRLSVALALGHLRIGAGLHALTGPTFWFEPLSLGIVF